MSQEARSRRATSSAAMPSGLCRPSSARSMIEQLRQGLLPTHHELIRVFQGSVYSVDDACKGACMSMRLAAWRHVLFELAGNHASLQ